MRSLQTALALAHAARAKVFVSFTPELADNVSSCRPFSVEAAGKSPDGWGCSGQRTMSEFQQLSEFRSHRRNREGGSGEVESCAKPPLETAFCRLQKHQKLSIYAYRNRSGGHKKTI